MSVRPPGRDSAGDAQGAGGWEAGARGADRRNGGADAARGETKGIAVAIAEVSERASTLVREEIELAKAEVAEKAARLLKGTVVGVVAGIFFLTALFFVLVGCAWLLYYYLPIGNQYTYFWGFFAMALILVILGAIAGLIAARAVKRGAPPTPEMAIEEARLIRETVSATEVAPPGGPAAAPASSVAGTTTPPAPYGAATPHASGAPPSPAASSSPAAPASPTAPASSPEPGSPDPTVPPSTDPKDTA